MVTRSQRGSTKLSPQYTLISMCSPIRNPKCLNDAVSSPLWLDQKTINKSCFSWLDMNIVGKQMDL